MSDDAFAAPTTDTVEPVHDGAWVSTWWACRLTQAAVLATASCNLAFAVGVLTVGPALLDESDPDGSSLSIFQAVFALVAAGAYMAGVVAFLTAAISWWTWQTRIRWNLRGDLEYGTYAWVWWFVPIAHLFVPYRVHGELWQAAGRREISYPVPEYMLAWWLCWLVYTFSWRMADRVFDTAGQTGMGGVAFVVAALFGMVAAGLAVWTVGDITARERESRST